ncbi:MAG: helix-turn-helix domain-containing protein [Pseudomonadota bacterium]
MDNEQEAVVEELPLEGVGAKLRRAREEGDLTIAQVSAETRIPERHLEVIEAGNFTALPARTYAIGFSRTYAKMLGLDDVEIADQVRTELNEAEAEREYVPAGMEPGDPAKLPSSGLAWAGVFGAVLLIAGMATFYSTYYSSGAGPASLIDNSAPPLADGDANGGGGNGSASQQAGFASSDGQVVFTALEDGVWVKFYDVGGERLFEKQMASGERFEIPSDAQGPQIWTGRPDAFAITIDGRSVPKLAEDDFIMRDVSISAEALLARAEREAAAAAGQGDPAESQPSGT